MLGTMRRRRNGMAMDSSPDFPSSLFVSWMDRFDVAVDDDDDDQHGF